MTTPKSVSPLKGKRVNRKPLIIAAVLLSLFVLFMIQAGKSRREVGKNGAQDETSVNKTGSPGGALSIDLSEHPDSVGIHKENEVEKPSKDEKDKKERDIEAEVLKEIQDQQMKKLRRDHESVVSQEKRLKELEAQSREGDTKMDLKYAESLVDSGGSAIQQESKLRHNKDESGEAQSSGFPGGRAGKEDGSSLVDKGVAEKREYLSQGKDDEFILSERSTLPLSDYEIKTGDIIPATLITAINSSLPGNITAQVSRHVYDSRTGKHVLIPQGSKLFGRYDSHTSLGEDRLLVVWDRIIFPDTETLVINGMQGVDGRGMSGLKDKVNTHFAKTLVNAFLLSIVSATADKYDKNDSTGLLGDIRSEYGDTMERVISEYLNSRLNIKPELEIRAGARFNVMVEQDLIFDSPYKYGFEKVINKRSASHENN